METLWFVVALGALVGPGEVARARNATGGHEPLIARWSSGVGLGLHFGVGTRWAGLELSGLASSTAIQVKNAAGVAFPAHGDQPFAWSAGVNLFPLAPLLGRRAAVRPFVSAGIGGLLLSADLDNIRGKTLYHSFHWMLSGGSRMALSSPNFLELRITRLCTWANAPLRGFVIVAATAGFGLQF